MTTTTSTRELRVTLTAEERAEHEKSCATLIRDLDVLEAKKREAVSEWNAKIKTLKKRMAKASEAAVEGFEVRDVECEDRPDFDSKVVRTVRTDTGDVVETRSMTADERQDKLPFTATPTGEKKRLRAVKGSKSEVADDVAPAVDPESAH